MNTQALRLLILNRSRQPKKGSQCVGRLCRLEAKPRGWSTVKGGGKKVKRRKRHIVVDSQGLLIGVLVTEANASERLGAVLVLDEATFAIVTVGSCLGRFWLFGKKLCSSSQASLWRAGSSRSD